MLTPSTKSRKPETMNQYDIGLKIYESAEAPPYTIRNLPVIETELLENQGFRRSHRTGCVIEMRVGI